MGTIDAIQANIGNETRNCNVAMNVVLQGLENEGFITPEQYGEITRNYALIIIKPNWFVSVMRKFLGPKEDDWYYNMIKVVSKDKDAEKTEEEDDARSE